MSHILKMLLAGLSAALLLTATGCKATPAASPPPLTPEAAVPAAYPDYTRRIIFSAAGDLHVMHANGAGRQNLTPNTPSYETMPAWSPDGRFIAFVSDRAGNEDIYLAPASAPGDPAQQVAVTQTPDLEHAPAWATTGHRLAFAANTNESWGIYIVDLSLNDYLPTDPVSLGPLRRTYNLRTDSHPTWAADASRLAYTSDQNGRWQVFQMPRDGSQQEAYPGSEALSGNAHPDWSPDMTRMAVSGRLNNNWDIYVIDARDGLLHQLTTHPAKDWGPRWSPDGEWIVFVSERSGNGDLYLVRADGSAEWRLTDSPAVEVSPDWEP